MFNGIETIECSRPGCCQLVGAREYSEGRIVQEEFYPDVVKKDENTYYCKDCYGNDEFKSPEFEEILEERYPEEEEEDEYEDLCD